MKISMLKSVTIMVSFLFLALLSKIQGADDISDLREKTLYKSNYNSIYLNHLKPEIDINSQDKALRGEEEKSEISWAYYVVSPVKSLMGWTYNVADFAVKNPKQAIVTSLLVAAQVTAVAASNHCTCVFELQDGSNFTQSFLQSCAGRGKPNVTACQAYCQNFNDWLKYSCER